MTRSLSFRFGYIITLVAAVVAAILLLAALFFVNDFYSNSVRNAEQHMHKIVKTQLAKDTEVLGDTLSDLLASVIARKDSEAISQALIKRKEIRGLSFFTVYDARGKLLYSHSPAGMAPDPPTTNIRITQQDNQIWAYIPVHFQGKDAGYIFYGVSLSTIEPDIHHNSAALKQNAREALSRLLMGLIGGFIALLLLTLPIAQILAKRLLQPLDELTEKSRSFKVYGEPVSFRMNRKDELGELGDALQEMQEHLYDSHEQMALMAFRDPLTSLPNRRGLYQELRKLILWGQQNQRKIALLFIDLDHFKQVNDSSSHEYGDLILKEVAQRLMKTVRLQLKNRQQPFPEDLLLARLGGDEFVAILPDIEWLDDATLFSDRIIQALQQPFAVNDKYFSLSCSIGITMYPDDATSAENMLSHADTAMYEAKRAGRNRARFFLPEMHHQVEERIAIQQGIRTALVDDQLYLEYQPIFDLSSNTMIGAESLLRWRHPDRGRMEPETFIPIIEESDQIGALTDWILYRVFEDMERLETISQPFKLTVNISSVILNQPELAQRLHMTLMQLPQPAQKVCLEITETSLMENLEQTLPLLQKWKKAGFSIWIDDFGTGYSSLNYLARLPIDGVKIDRSFILDFENSKPVIEAILALADAMGILVVSEGIEEQEQGHELHRMGCLYGQGYLMSGPVSLDQLLLLAPDLAEPTVMDVTDDSLT